MKSYIDMPELKKVHEFHYSEDEVQVITDSYFKFIKVRMREILLEDKKYDDEAISEILRNLGYATNHVKSEKSFNDCLKNKL